MNRLEGRTVFITGASSGIGEACARAFVHLQSRLVLAARRTDRLRRLSEELENTGAAILTLQLDVRDRQACTQTIANLPDEYKDVEVLVNNAGLASGLDPVQDGDHDDWDIMVDTNVKGLLNVTRAILPGMIERNAGHVINIGSISGRQVYPNGTVYCATKYAVRALTQGMMMDLVDTPVRVTTIDPGLVETEFSLVRFKGDRERAETAYQGMTPLTGEDVADAVVYCATRPAHVDVAELVLLPTDQASVYHVRRDM